MAITLTSHEIATLAEARTSILEFLGIGTAALLIALFLSFCGLVAWWEYHERDDEVDWRREPLDEE